MFKIFFVSLLFTFPVSLFAFPNAGIYGSIYSSPDKLALPPANVDRFEKLNHIWDHIGVGAEPSAFDQYGLSLFRSAQTKASFEELLKWIDPNKNLSRYANWDTKGIKIYQDRDTKKVLDFELSFKQEGFPSDPNKMFTQLLTQIRGTTKDLPLHGIRIALDPGHMGSDDCGKHWDRITGKFNRSNGRCISEGTIAYKVCALLGERLEKLGASVLITRSANSPASDQEIHKFDLKEIIKEELYQATDIDWFDAFLNKTNSVQKIGESFLFHPQYQKISDGRLRGHYFVFHEDLKARVKKIEEFSPHFTFIVHFDASQNSGTQQAANAIRTFVPGNIKGAELASREQRAAAIRTLVDPNRFIGSVMFSQHVVDALSKQLNIPLKKDPVDIGGIRISDGVYARNLALTRSLTKGVSTYLEVLYYDYYKEHALLAKTDVVRKVTVSGKELTLSYSNRLDEIADGLNKGLLNYVNAFFRN